MAPILTGLVLALATSASAQLSAVSWGKNRGDVFGTYQGRLFHKFWTGHDWQPASAEFLASDNSVALTGAPTAISWGENRLDVFYSGQEDPSGQDSKAYHLYWDGDSWEPAGGSSGLGEDLGGPVLGEIAATTAGEGHVDLVALTLKGDYVHKYLDGDAWHPDGWESLGGSFFSTPATVRVGNQLHVFGVDAENATLMHKYWNGDSWVGWEDLGGGPLASLASASSWGPDRFDVWAVAQNGSLQHLYFQTDAYSAWESLGGEHLAVPPAVASQRPGVVDLVAAKMAKGGLTYLSKSYDGSRWWPAVDEWYEHTTTTFAGAPTAVSWTNTTVAYFGATRGDKLVFRFWWGQGWYPEDGSWAELADLKGAAAEKPSGKTGLHAQELR